MHNRVSASSTSRTSIRGKRALMTREFVHATLKHGPKSLPDASHLFVKKHRPMVRRHHHWHSFLTPRGWSRYLLPFIAVLFATMTSTTPRADADEQWVTVGHPGNEPDRTGYGAVTYAFEIMKHEVRVAHYAAFLNEVAAADDPHQLWQRAMGEHVITDLGQGGIRKDVPQCILRQGQPGKWHYVPAPEWEDRPVIFVTCFSAMRYANWIHNGRGNGDTETGVYRMTDGLRAKRSPDARVWLPSEDEWYKAAYFQPRTEGGPSGNYWKFPSSTMERPTKAEPGSKLATAAAFSRGFGGIVPVGSYPHAKSPWGALDMGGNVWEWTDDVVHESKRVIRGGAAAHTWQKLQSTVRSNARPSRWYPDTGFRLARKVEP